MDSVHAYLVKGHPLDQVRTFRLRKLKRIPSDERVLIFVQFFDLMKKVAEVLNANKV
jgi:hypothetical protein